MGRPGPDLREVVVALVVADEGGPPEEAALDGSCFENNARLKCPKAWRFVEALPQNNCAKVLKTALREMPAGLRET